MIMMMMMMTHKIQLQHCRLRADAQPSHVHGGTKMQPIGHNDFSDLFASASCVLVGGRLPQRQSAGSLIRTDRSRGATLPRSTGPRPLCPGPQPLRASHAELRVRGVLASLCHPEHCAVCRGASQRGDQRSVTTESPSQWRGAINHQIQSAPVGWVNIGHNCVRQPLLGNHLPIRAYCLSGHARPRPFQDLSPAC